MKTVYSLIVLSFLFVLLLVTPVNGSSDEWVEYGRDNNGDVYSYTRVSLKEDRETGIVQVWDKKVYSDEGRENLIQLMRKGGVSTEGWEELSHTLTLQEIDCKKGRFQILFSTHYDTNGFVLYSYSYDEPNWNYILPDSTVDTLRKKVCK